MDVSVPKEPLTESYVNAVCTEPVVDITVRQALEIVADKHPDHPSFIFSHFNQELTNARLLKKADEYAKGFLALGLEKGDRVLEAGLSDEEWVAVIFGAWSIGLIVQHVLFFDPVDTNLEQLVKKAGAKVLIMGKGRSTIDYIQPLLKVAPELKCSKDKHLNIARLPTVTHIFMHESQCDIRGSCSLKELVAIGAGISDPSLRKAIDSVDISDTAVMLSSTGTTGDPKLVCQSHRCLSNGLVSLAKRHNPYNEDMRVCQMSPLYDDLICLIFALPCIILPAMGCFNYTIVYTNNLTDTADKVFYMVETAARYKCNHIEWYPFIWNAIVEQGLLDKYDLSSVNGALVGGMKVNEESMESFNRHIKNALNIYAATEAEPISLQFVTDSLEIKKSTIGFPVRHTEVKLVNENDEIVAIGKEGEICVRGPTVFTGYWGDEELTRKVKDEHGWYHTGDIGKMLEHGHLSFVGRKADAIRYKRRGDVVYPGPIEGHAQTHPKVDSAAVVSLYRESVGDYLCLFVMAKENEELTEQEMRHHFEKGIDDRFRPDHYLFVDDIPTIGIRRKIPRRLLREAAEKALKEKIGSDTNYFI